MSGRGLVAVGDSITRGRGGAPALGVHPQSWALWLAEALELPYTNLATDGACAGDVVRDQLPRLGAGYDLGTLFVGANDARGLDFDAEAFERDVATVLRALGESAGRLLVLTLPEDLGRPPAGGDVLVANEILRRLAGEAGAAVVELSGFGGRRVMLPDAVHPTSVGMVAIADAAARALGDAPRMPSSLAEERRDPLARARYARWWGWQLARDLRRRAVERVRGP